MNCRPSTVQKAKWAGAEHGLWPGAAMLPLSSSSLFSLVQPWYLLRSTYKAEPSFVAEWESAGEHPSWRFGCGHPFLWRKKVEPHESDAGCPAWLSSRGLFLACSLSNHSQEDKQEKGLKYFQNLLNQWTGKTVSGLPLGNENRIHKPSS